MILQMHGKRGKRAKKTDQCMEGPRGNGGVSGKEIKKDSTITTMMRDQRTGSGQENHRQDEDRDGK